MGVTLNKQLNFLFTESSKQNPPIRSLHEHFAIFGKLLSAHHQDPDLSLDLLLQTGSQCPNFIHIHVADNQHINQAAVTPLSIVIEGIDGFNL